MKRERDTYSETIWTLAAVYFVLLLVLSFTH